MCGVIVDVEVETGACLAIRRFTRMVPEREEPASQAAEIG
jgi:hypothetical protein